jgi:thiamine-triphosphatase
MPSIEVEEKFCVTDRPLAQLERQLRESGFEQSPTVEMVDWYFDTESYCLVQKDCWLRFREKAGTLGQWELKRGQKDHQEGRATVYEEIEGDSAVSLASSLIQSAGTSVSVSASVSVTEKTATTDFQGYNNNTVPQVPGLDSLSPFARIVTRRASWRHVSKDHRFADLSVDLDTTDFDYAIGEVEAVVTSQEEVADARVRIQTLLNELVGGDSPKKPRGKLEHYLYRFRPQLYQRLVECGLMKE